MNQMEVTAQSILKNFDNSFIEHLQGDLDHTNRVRQPLKR